MSMSKPLPILPEELVTTEILHRLPAKSVGRFRCVSKGWRLFLSSRQFVKSHLNFNLRQHPLHLLVMGSDDNSCNVLTLDSGIASSKVITCPLEKEDRFFHLGSSCHGLVVVSVGDGFIRFLMNPITGEALRVRNWPIGAVNAMVHGLGYDASSDDYKIVNFSWCLGGTSIDVYSVRMKCWRKLPKPRVGFQAHVPFLNAVNGSVFVNGCIHWLGTADDSRNIRANRVGIYAFDLAREEFEELQPPSNVKLAFQNEYEIKLLGGCLALVKMVSPFPVDYRPSINVWLMKEYGVSDSWTKLTISSPEDRSIMVGEYEVMSLLNEDEVVLSSRVKFVAYNCRSGIWRDLMVSRLSVSKALGDSLVSPNYN